MDTSLCIDVVFMCLSLKSTLLSMAKFNTTSVKITVMLVNLVTSELFPNNPCIDDMVFAKLSISESLIL